MISGPLDKQGKSAIRAKSRLATTNNKLIAARLARVDLEEYERQSLPGNPAVAQERYQAYLIELLEKSRIELPTISPNQPRQRDGVYVVPFTVQAETDFESLTRLN